MLVAPSEPKALRALGTYSSECERFGCDYLFITSKGLVGVQRKELSDLVASLRDGRFARELGQIADSDLVTAALVIEGRVDPFSRVMRNWSKAEYQGLVLSVQSRGVWVVHTDSPEETADWLTRLPVWLDREEHGSLLRVPKQRSVSVQQRMLAQIDGVSLVRARGVEEMHGQVLGLTVSEETLLKTPGLGPTTVKRISEAFNAR